jgi:hypothetical protein
MKKNLLCAVTSILVLLFSFSVYSETLTVILQNSIDGYTGCSDAYYEENITDPVGAHTKLSLKYG